MEINIENIMHEIQNNQGEIYEFMPSQEKYIPTLEDVQYEIGKRRKKESFCFLNACYKVECHRAINNKNWLISWIKRIIRKMVKFYIVPIVSDQNNINANILQVLNAQEKEVRALRLEIEKLKK